MHERKYANNKIASSVTQMEKANKCFVYCSKYIHITIKLKIFFLQSVRFCFAQSMSLRYSPKEKTKQLLTALTEQKKLCVDCG